MMYQCGNGELLTGAALVHHDDKCLLVTYILKGQDTMLLVIDYHVWHTSVLL